MSTPSVVKELRREAAVVETPQPAAAPPRCRYPGCSEEAVEAGVATCYTWTRTKDGAKRLTHGRVEIDLIEPWTVCKEHLKLQHGTVRVTSLLGLAQKARKAARGDGFRVGDEVVDRDGDSSVIESIDEDGGLINTNQGWTYKPSDLTRVGR